MRNRSGAEESRTSAVRCVALVCLAFALERAAYYGLRANLLLYLTETVGHSHGRATAVKAAAGELPVWLPLVVAALAGVVPRMSLLVVGTLVAAAGAALVHGTALVELGLFGVALGAAAFKALVLVAAAEQFRSQRGRLAACLCVYGAMTSGAYVAPELAAAVGPRPTALWSVMLLAAALASASAWSMCPRPGHAGAPLSLPAAGLAVAALGLLVVPSVAQWMLTEVVTARFDTKLFELNTLVMMGGAVVFAAGLAWCPARWDGWASLTPVAVVLLGGVTLLVAQHDGSLRALSALSGLAELLLLPSLVAIVCFRLDARVAAMALALHAWLVARLVFAASSLLAPEHRVPVTAWVWLAGVVALGLAAGLLVGSRALSREGSSIAEERPA